MTTHHSQSFHLGDILSVTTGLLVSPTHMDGVYRLLGHMTGEALWTHQLPRAAGECRPELLRQHPDLADVQAPEEFASPDDVDPWLAERVKRFGEYREVLPLKADDHTSIDPVQELRMMRPDAEILTVEVEDR